MSIELLHYCTKALRERPRALNITQPLDENAQAAFTKAWAKLRFEEQQKSILNLSPDHPDFGRSYLWPYVLKWPGIDYALDLHPSSAPQPSLRIEHHPESIAATPRELILLASVSQVVIPFLDPAGNSYSRQVFRAAKSRMMGSESRRPGAAIFPPLQAGVANVQYLCQNGSTILSAIHLADVVSIEN